MIYANDIGLNEVIDSISKELGFDEEARVVSFVPADEPATEDQINEIVRGFGF